MHPLIIFWSKSEQLFSPAVAPSSTKTALEMILTSNALACGNDVHTVCAHFIGWCMHEANDNGFLSVHNLPEIPWQAEARERSDWYVRLMDELSHHQPVPYLVDVHTLEITHGELVIHKPKFRHRIRIPNRRERESLSCVPKLSLHDKCTLTDAVAALGGGVSTNWCDGQFIRLPNLTLCFAAAGGPLHGFQVVSPSKFIWRPTRLDYHPDHSWPWFPDLLAENGYTQHLFIHSESDEYIYLGVANLACIQRGERELHFYLDVKLPRELWKRFGNFDAWRVTVSAKELNIAAGDRAAFLELLSDLRQNLRGWNLKIFRYEEDILSVDCNDRRARFHYYKGFKTHCLESWDPHYCGSASAIETVGHDIEPIICPAFRTVSRLQAEQALLEYFDTGTLPRCIRWAWVEDGITPETSWMIV